MTYNLPIQIMLLDHDRIDRLGISKSQEAESSGPASGIVSHDSAFLDLAELGEVVMHRFYAGLGYLCI